MAGLTDGSSDNLVDPGASAADFVTGRTSVSVTVCLTLLTVTDLSWLLEWLAVYAILGQRASLRTRYAWPW